MYSINRAVYDEMIHARNREVEWYGTITLTNGSSIDFDKTKIDQNTGELKKSCSDSASIGIGRAYASELSFRLRNTDIDRYLLYNGVIDLYSKMTYETGIPTWGELEAYTWEELAPYTWGNLLATRHQSIPMGKFIIKEATQTANRISIVAYDNMILFEKPLISLSDIVPQTPYQWLVMTCAYCGVTLGLTYEQIFGLPNGRRLTQFANSDSTMKTWRDVISALAAMLGGNAIIDRSGQLVIKQYNNIIADAITAGMRYSSDFSDYQSYYTGLYLTYKEKNIKEYVKNVETTEEDTGLAYDLGANPFMQIDDDTNRAAMMQAIIDRQAGLVYTPFKVQIPFNPCFDLMDTLLFIDNQATSQDIAPITSIVFRIGGKMDISCGGENPALMDAESKESKAIEGMSASAAEGDNLWLLMGDAPSSNLTIHADTETLVGEILLYAKEINSMVQIAYTATYELSKTALVTVKFVVDEADVYSVEQNQFIGENKITATTGHQFRGTGSHSVKAYLKVSESSLDTGGGGVLTTLNVTENGLYTARDAGVYGFSQVTVQANDLLGYYASANSEEKEGVEVNAVWTDTAQYYVTAVYGHENTQATVNATLDDYTFVSAVTEVQE